MTKQQLFIEYKTTVSYQTWFFIITFENYHIHFFIMATKRWGSGNTLNSQLLTLMHAGILCHCGSFGLLLNCYGYSSLSRSTTGKSYRVPPKGKCASWTRQFCWTECSCSFPAKPGRTGEVILFYNGCSDLKQRQAKGYGKRQARSQRWSPRMEEQKRRLWWSWTRSLFLVIITSCNCF